MLMLKHERGNPDERGSLVITITVVMVVTGMLVVTLTTVYNGMRTAKVDQNRTNAFQYANAGVDRALYRIDREDMPIVPQSRPADAAGESFQYTPVTVTGGQVTRFRERITKNGSRFDVEAFQDPAGQDTFWTVRSLGHDRMGRERLTVATLSATPLFQHGFFTETVFDLRGLQRSPIAYRSTLCVDPRVSTGPNCDIRPVPGRLGTNASVVLSSATLAQFQGPPGLWEGFTMYGRETQPEADAACTIGGSSQTCGTAPFILPHTERLDTTPPDPPGGTCFNNGDWTNQVVPPGDYVCERLTLEGTVSVGTPADRDVRVWVVDNPNTAGVGPTMVAGAQRRAVINRGERPKRMQIYFPATAGPNGSTICDAELWAALYTPGLNVNCGGSHQPTIYGAVVAKIHNAGGNDFDFHWDLDLQSTFNDGLYRVTNWRECPPTTTSTC